MSIHFVHYWIKQGQIAARQIDVRGPWWIPINAKRPELPIRSRYIHTSCRHADYTSRSLVAPLLHQHVEFSTVLIDRSPQQIRLIARRHGHFVQMPCAAQLAPLSRTARIWCRTSRTSNGSFRT